MNDKRYWFPVRPARNGWGWGTPVVWQGWVAWLILFAVLLGGLILLAPYGTLALSCWGTFIGCLFIALGFWKGEPQSMRDNSSS